MDVAPHLPPPGAWVWGEGAGPSSQASCPHGPSGIRLRVAWGKSWWAVSFGKGPLEFPECWCLPQPAATHH